MPPNIRKRAPANSNKNTRLHIAFDEKERTDYLSGFSKRKQERRRYGLAMGELKRKRQLLEERKERRALQKDSQPQIEDEHVEVCHFFFQHKKKCSFLFIFFARHVLIYSLLSRGLLEDKTVSAYDIRILRRANDGNVW